VTRSVYAEINPEALQHNIRVIRNSCPDPSTKLLFMIKANAYGHGLGVLLPFIDGVDALGVATISGAIELRQQGYSQLIVLMPGFCDAADLLACITYQVIPVIHSWYQIDLLSQMDQQSRIDCWLKVDTGMSRLGFSCAEFPDALKQLLSFSTVNQDALVIVSHLATADDVDDVRSEEQTRCFEQVTQGLSIQKSLCNSAALFRFPRCHYDWVRPGIALYGISPLIGVSAAELNLRPVMTLKARIIAIRNLCEGEYIGYGGVYQCSRPTRIAVVNIGYGDGYPRNAPQNTPVLVRGVRCPLVGRVSMDMLTIDITHLSDISSEDEVVLWGEGLPVNEVAACIGDLTYEMLAKVTSRVEIKIASSHLSVSS
jgi:alanine racemase